MAGFHFCLTGQVLITFAFCFAFFFKNQRFACYAVHIYLQLKLQKRYSCARATVSLVLWEGCEFDFWRRRLRIRFLAEKAANSISVERVQKKRRREEKNWREKGTRLTEIEIAFFAARNRNRLLLCQDFPRSHQTASYAGYELLYNSERFELKWVNVVVWVIVRVCSVVLRRTVVGVDWRFDNLSGSFRENSPPPPKSNGLPVDQQHLHHAQ